MRPLWCLAALAAASAAPSPCSLLLAPTGDVLELRNGFVRLTFNLTRGSVDVVQGRFVGDGNFSASPNLAGMQAAPAFTRRGAVAVVVSGTAGGGAFSDPSTASIDRASPLPFIVTANSSAAGACGFTVSLTDNLSLVRATLGFSLSGAAPRELLLSASAVAQSAISPTVISLSTLWTAPSATGFYIMDGGAETGIPLGVRQGMQQGAGFLASSNALARSYVIGDGATGALEALPRAQGNKNSSWIFAGRGAPFATAGGLGFALFGTAPEGGWTSDFSQGKTVVVRVGDKSAAVAVALLPNDLPFPPSKVPPQLPPGVVLDDLQATLQAAHGAVVAPLHSYDFSPEVRAAPCLTIRDGNCYGDTWNYYDPDSGISNSALLYTFDEDLLEQVRGQLETNIQMVCPDNANPSRCIAGQCIHHYVGSCGGGPECFCNKNPNGQQDCVQYDSLAGGVQSGPNVFTTLASLRYAGASGNLAWLSAHMPVLRSMVDFLEPSYDAKVGLYNVPGSLQIDVFVRANYTADSNAMFIILFELFADAEAAVNNATGVAFCTQRAAALRAGMNEYLLSPEGDHFCTQSDPQPDGSVKICARDFVDYDANAIAIAARVPTSAAVANKIFARMDGGKCTHAGRATYVSEKYYDAENCVGGNTGDSAVTMGRIGWQDAMARHAVGDAAAVAAFENVLLAPLQRDLLKRTWLPERFNCDGTDAHNEYYFEYPATVVLMLYEVKYGISLQMTNVVVDPLAPPAGGFTYALGGVLISWSPATFHCELLLAHAGSRDFRVTKMAPGSYTVAPAGLAPFSAGVAADGVLLFSVPVGKGHAVDVIKRS